MARIAVLQVPSTHQHAEAFALCLRLVEQAVREHGAQIVVCPAVYVGDAQPGDEPVSPVGAIEQALVDKARDLGIWIVASMQARENERHCLATPSGEIHRIDAEQGPSPRATPVVVETPHGNIGLCAGGSVFGAHLPRLLAGLGADLLCASLGASSAADCALRLPARAAENQVFVAVAATAGGRDLYPHWKETLPPELADRSAERGVSQIVARDGGLLASVVAEAGALVCVEVELTQARQTRAEPAPLPRLLRSDAYRARAAAEAERAPLDPKERLEVVASGWDPGESVESALVRASELLDELAREEVDLLVLPELFCFPLEALRDGASASRDFGYVVRRLAEACQETATHVVTSLVEDVGGQLFHMGVLIGQAGVVMRQPQLQVPARYGWAKPGDRLEIARLPWGKLALAVGEDALLPELTHALGLHDVDLVAAPMHGELSPHALLSLPALADEARYALVAALRVEPMASPSSCASLVADPAHWPVKTADGERRSVRAVLRPEVLRSERRGPRARVLVSDAALGSTRAP